MILVLRRKKHVSVMNVKDDINVDFNLHLAQAFRAGNHFTDPGPNVFR